MHRSTYSLALGVVLVLSGIGVPVTAGPASSATAGDQSVGAATGLDVGVTTQNESISALEAMEVAQNRTNGTVIGVERTENNTVYEVHAVRGNLSANNRTFVQVRVHAVNGTVLGVDSQAGRSTDVIGTEDRARIESLNLSTVRSAVEATRIAVNQSYENSTVAEVTLTLANQSLSNNISSPLIYEITVQNVNGQRVAVLVAAREGQGGVIAVNPVEDDENDG